LMKLRRTKYCAIFGPPGTFNQKENTSMHYQTQFTCLCEKLQRELHICADFISPHLAVEMQIRRLTNEDTHNACKVNCAKIV